MNMKKRIIFLLSILMIGLSFLLSSCDYSEEVGVWIVERSIPIENNKKFTTASDLEDYRISLGIEYYVDGYTSEKAKSHLNGEVDFFHTITYTQESELFYRVVDVKLENGIYTLDVGEALMPSQSDISPTNTFTMTRTVKDSKIYIYMQYLRNGKQS